MKMKMPFYSQPRLGVFLRNPANDSVHPDNIPLEPLPRDVTDRFQNWAAGQIDSLVNQLNRMKKIMQAKESIIVTQAETISDLRFQLAEANNRADKDGLTGLFNKAYFMRELYAIHQDNVSKSDRRNREADVILMIDLDGFKPINDNFGHTAGDEALCEVSRLLESCVRDTDTVARVGGDEFAVILRGSSMKDARTKEKEISQKLNSLSFVYNEAVIAVRGSVGSTPIDWKKTPIENFETADSNMYQIKHAKGDTRFTLNVA